MDELKPVNIVIGQAVREGKALLARRMRQEMTPGEAKLWGRLRRSELGVNFRRQQVIDGFIADFHCHAAALVAGVDGAAHGPEYDAERDRIFAERGLTVLRVTNAQVRDQIGVVLYQTRYQIRRHLRTLNAATDPGCSVKC